MSWKPSRSSGVMFDSFTEKSKINWEEINRMIETNEYLMFKNLNKFSKHIYLYWLNDNKAHCALISKRFDKNNPFRDINDYFPYPTIKSMLLRNKDLLHKPLLNILN